MGPLTAEIMKKALARLDALLSADKTAPIELIMGGGGAMILAHEFPLGTTDIDAIAKGIELNELNTYIEQIAKEQGIAKDWLNPYFSTFSYTLPADYGTRLIEVFRGATLRVLALGKEEMLIMKCFAHRQKDVSHAKALIKKGANLKLVEEQIDTLQHKRIRGAQEAMAFLDDVLDQLG